MPQVHDLHKFFAQVSEEIRTSTLAYMPEQTKIQALLVTKARKIGLAFYEIGCRQITVWRPKVV